MTGEGIWPMNRTHHYDAVVIGAGQGGIPLAMALGRVGRTTALIEREHVGGTCINEGCTPTKTMVASGRVAYLARRAADYGVHTGPMTIDLARVRQRKREIVASFRSGSQARIEHIDGVELIMGEARFTSANSVEVSVNGGEMRHLGADLIFINTGDRPADSRVDGVGTVPVFNSTSI